MARFFGIVGFVHEEVDEVTAPGVYVQHPTERYYYGDIISNVRRWDDVSTLNDDVSLGNRISIVGDQFAYNNFFAMRYVNWKGINWNVKSVEIKAPRILISLGGVYNGITSQTP